MSEDTPSTKAPTRGRRRRFLWKTVVNLLLLAGIFTVYNLAMGQLSDRWTATAPRDMQTSILAGAEELWLGPEDADAAVLLVHGFVGGSNNFSRFPNVLAREGFRVRAMRLPGHGTDPREFARTPASEFPLAVLREVRALREKHDRVYLAGHSMGGSLITLAATMEEVDGLILAAPYFGVTYQWYYLLPPETWVQLTRGMVRWVYKSEHFVRVNREEAKEEIFSYPYIPTNGSWTLMQLGQRARDPFVLSEVNCPVIMFHAPEDFAASYQASREAFAKIGTEDKTFITCENSDHHLFWDEDSQMVVSRSLKFLKDIEARHTDEP